MCDDCFDEDEEDGAAPRYASEELIEATRLVEADLPGARVDEAMWPIFFGMQAGGIDWPSFERMARSREAALVLLDTARGVVAA